MDELTTHDHVLIALNQFSNGGSMAALLIHAQSMRPSTTRAYLYKVMAELRRRGQVRTENKQSPTQSRHYITDRGRTYVRGLLHEEA